jgi:hypothetical protein
MLNLSIGEKTLLVRRYNGSISPNKLGTLRLIL